MSIAYRDHTHIKEKHSQFKVVQSMLNETRWSTDSSLKKFGHQGSELCSVDVHLMLDCVCAWVPFLYGNLLIGLYVSEASNLQVSF